MFGTVVERDEAHAALAAQMASVCGVVNAADARLVELIASALETDVWQEHGVHSPEHWVAWKCGLSRGRAHQLVLLARRLPELPTVKALFDAGELSTDQTAVVARHTPAEKDVEVAEVAPYMTVAQLRRTLSRYAFHGPPEPSEEPTPPPPVEEPRECDFGTDDAGNGWLRALLPADEWAVVEAGLRARRDRLFHDTNGEQRDQLTWADALIDMADAALGHDERARPHHLRHRVLLHLETVEDRPQAWFHKGDLIDDFIRRYLTCDCDVTPIFEAAGLPVSVGRTQRIVPDRTRLLVEHRDQCCRVPGCDANQWLHVHHLWHWEDGGPTDTWNLICLCPKHHRMHHQGHLGITGNADQPSTLCFTDRWGRTIPGAGKAKPPGDPPAQAAARLHIPTQPYTHPTGERLRYDDVYFGGPISPN